MHRIVIKRILKSNIPKKYKEQIKTLKVHVCVHNSMVNFEGWANYDMDSVYSKPYINLARWLFSSYCFNRILQTYSHEFAHILAIIMYKQKYISDGTGPRGWHNKEWQKLNYICGGDWHNYDYTPRIK